MREQMEFQTEARGPNLTTYGASRSQPPTPGRGTLAGLSVSDPSAVHVCALDWTSESPGGTVSARDGKHLHILVCGCR